ncbi:MAG: hypothetical protein JO362_14855 [Streptomycetaceae bacterium]|nr:hypothetical protein [Streptomycetaceae bacterium]
MGLDGGGIPGDPQKLQGIIDDFTYLRDTAWSVSQGLDAFVASASSGGFEGETADALREVISGRLKTFVFNIARAFSLAGEAVAEYRLVLVQAQRAVGGMVAQAEGLTAGDPKLSGLRSQVQEQLNQVNDAAQTMEQALRDASDMVSQPIKVPSLFEKIWKGTEIVLEITAMVLFLLSSVVTGPLGDIAFGLAAMRFAMSVADFTEGRTNWQGLALNTLGMLMPGGRGLFTMEEAGAGLRGALGALASPSQLVRGEQMLGRLPRLLLDGVRALPSVVASIPKAIEQDFARAVKWYPGLVEKAGAHTAYGVVNLGRAAGMLFTPMAFDEMATLGFRGAWQLARDRASWTAAAQAFRTGWASYGVRAAHAAMDVWQMLHGIRPFLPEGTRVGAKAGPQKWMGTADKLREPAEPVTTWTARDRAYGFVFIRPDSERLLLGVPAPGPGSGRALEISGSPAGSLKEQKITQDGKDGLLTTRGGLLVPIGGVLPPQSLQVLRERGAQGLPARPSGTTPVPQQETAVPVVGDQVIAPVTTGGEVRQTLELLRAQTGMGRNADPGVLDSRTGEPVNQFRFRPLSPFEALGGPRGPQTLQASLRYADARGLLDISEGGKNEVPLGDAVQPELHTITEELHTVKVDPGHPEITVQVMSHQVTSSGVQHVTLPPMQVQTGVVRELSLTGEGIGALAGLSLREQLGLDRHAGETVEVVPAEKLLVEASGAVRAWLESAGSSRGAHIEGFTVTSLPWGGIAVVDEKTGLRTVFEASEGRVEWISREFRLGGVPREMDGLTVDVSRMRNAEGTTEGTEVLSYRLADKSGSAALTRFDFRTLDTTGSRPGRFEVTDAVYGHRYVFDADAELTTREVRLGGGLGRYVRFDATGAAGPQERLPVLRPNGTPSARWSGWLADGGRVRLVRSGAPADSVEHLEFDARSGQLLTETGAVRSTLWGKATDYLKIDYSGSRPTAKYVDAQGHPVADGSTSDLSVQCDRRGGIKVRKETASGHKTLFERPSLGDGAAAGMLPLGPGRFEFHVGLPGGDSLVRIEAPVGVTQALRLVHSHDGEPVVVPVEFSRQGETLTVCVAVPGAMEGKAAEYRFALDGQRLREVLPLVGGTEDGQVAWLHPEHVSAPEGGAPAEPDHHGEPSEAIVAISRLHPGALDALKGLYDVPNQARQEAYEALLADAQTAVRLHAHSPAAAEMAEHAGFTIVPLPDGGRLLEHQASGLHLQFDAQRRWTSREYWPAGAPRTMDGLKAVVVRSWDDEGQQAFLYRLEGACGAVARFDVTAVPGAAAHAALGRFTAVDVAYGHRYYFDADSVNTVHEILIRDFGYVRRDLREGGQPPQVLDGAGQVRDEWRVEVLDRDRLMLKPVHGKGWANERLVNWVVDAHTGHSLEVCVWNAMGAALRHTRYSAAGPESAVLVVPIGHGQIRVLPRAHLGAPLVNVGGELIPPAHVYRPASPRNRPGLFSTRKGIKQDLPQWAPVPDDTPLLRFGPGRFAFIDRLPEGAWRGLRIDAPALSPLLRLVDSEGRPVLDVPAQFARNADGLTVRVPVAGALEGAMAEYRFANDGSLLHEEIPNENHIRDLPLGQRRYLRVGGGPWDGILRVIGRHGDALTGWRVERLDGDRLAAMPTAWDHLPESERPLTRIVVDPGHGVVEEILGVHPKGAELPFWYWELDYASRPRLAVPVRLDGTKLDPADLVQTPDGNFCVEREGEVLLNRSSWDVVAGKPVEARVLSESPLPGRELSGMGLRLLETGEGPEATRWREVVDLSAPHRPTGWTAADRYDGRGTVIADAPGDRRWYLSLSHTIDFQDVRLTGTERFVRFVRLDGESWIVEANGDIVERGYVLEPVTDARTGHRTGLTVRLVKPAEPGETVVWHFDGERRPTDGTEVRSEP